MKKLPDFKEQLLHQEANTSLVESVVPTYLFVHLLILFFFLLYVIVWIAIHWLCLICCNRDPNFIKSCQDVPGGLSNKI